LVSARAGIFEDVLQETLLITCRKGNLSQIGTAHVLEVSSPTKANITPIGEFRFPEKRSAPWFIPRSPGQIRLVRNLSRMKTRLRDYAYRVSTGPLVWNRHKSRLRDQQGAGCYPLIWAESVTRDGRFVFRATKKNHKPFYEPKKSENWLIVRQPCVLLQRTTAKEQNRRLIAAELPRSFVEKYGAVVIENHVNMIMPVYGQAKVTPATLVVLLNSRVVDEAFRCINGSVAVSAYELAALPLPSIEQARRIGSMIEAGASGDEVEREVERIYVHPESTACDSECETDPASTGENFPRRVA
jgi:adenine-specific DNA-methyltransferase